MLLLRGVGRNPPDIHPTSRCGWIRRTPRATGNG